MNKEYLKWLRKLKEERLFQTFGDWNYPYLRQLFRNQFTPSDAALMFIPW